MANSTAVISLHLGSKRACHPGGGRLGWIWNSWTIIKTRGVSVTIGVEAGGGRLGWRWNSWTIIKTRRVSRSKTPSEVSGISAAVAMRGLFHATPRWRRVHYKSIRANKAFSCSVSGGVNTRSKPRMWRETFRRIPTILIGITAKSVNTT